MEGSQAAIWSASVLGIIRNVMAEPLGTLAETPVLSVTVVAATFCTVVPGVILMPKTAIPVLIPLVPPAPPKVIDVVPDRQSAVVVAVTGGIA